MSKMKFKTERARKPAAGQSRHQIEGVSDLTGPGAQSWPNASRQAGEVACSAIKYKSHCLRFEELAWVDLWNGHACRQCVPSHFSHVQLLATPWTLARQAPLSMGFPRQEYQNGLPFPSPEDLPDPKIADKWGFVQIKCVHGLTPCPSHDEPSRIT